MTYALYYDIYSIVDLRPGFKRKAHYFFDRSGTTRSEYTIILSYRVPADASNVTLFPYLFSRTTLLLLPHSLDREI